MTRETFLRAALIELELLIAAGKHELAESCCRLLQQSLAASDAEIAHCGPRLLRSFEQARAIRAAEWGHA